MQTAIYMRVSTTQQASEEQSLEAQEKILKDYAANHPNIIIRLTPIKKRLNASSL